MLLKMALALSEWACRVGGRAAEMENGQLENLPVAVLEGHEPFNRWSHQTNERRPDDEGEQKSQAEPSGSARCSVAAARISQCGKAIRLIVLSIYLSLHNFQDESPP